MKQQGKRLDFSKQELFIGLDVHKRSWTITIRIEILEFTYEIWKEQLANYIDELLILRKRKLKILQSLERHLQKYNLYNKIKLLLTIPGISYITATTLLTEIADIQRFKSTDRFASYIGLVPSIKYICYLFLNISVDRCDKLVFN